MNGTFGAVDDCVGYFSIASWSVLIIMFLFIAILTYGFMMLANIQPNELYEDPKKKQIQLGSDN